MKNPPNMIIKNCKDYWPLLLGLAAYIGIYTAQMWVMLPDWWSDFVGFWFKGGWRP